MVVKYGRFYRKKKLEDSNVFIKIKRNKNIWE
jgi:hypothetical protein